MPQVSSLSRPIDTPVQLLVEGRTPEIFFREMIASLRLVDRIQVRDFGSITDLTPYLETFVGLAGFKENVTSVGIIRDAEDQPAMRAFENVCASLAAVKLIRPDAIGTVKNGTVKTGIFILPNCADVGMLETVCTQAAVDVPQGPATLKCVDAYLECIQASVGNLPNNPTKARIWTFLAVQNISDPLVGRAAQANIWPWESPAFASLKAFITAL